jgi:hypothetical protein
MQSFIASSAGNHEQKKRAESHLPVFVLLGDKRLAVAE